MVSCELKIGGATQRIIPQISFIPIFVVSLREDDSARSLSRVLSEKQSQPRSDAAQAALGRLDERKGGKISLKFRDVIIKNLIIVVTSAL